MAVADFSRFHIVRFRDESQVSICRALVNALARMAALVLLPMTGLERVTVLAEEFI